MVKYHYILTATRMTQRHIRRWWDQWRKTLKRNSPPLSRRRVIIRSSTSTTLWRCCHDTRRIPSTVYEEPGNYIRHASRQCGTNGAYYAHGGSSPGSSATTDSSTPVAIPCCSHKS